MLKLIAKFATCLVLLASASHAQNESLKLFVQQNPELLKENPDILERLPRSTVNERSSNKSGGIPNSFSPLVPNTNDLSEDLIITLKNNALKDKGMPILKMYYSILTGELLPVYGANEFDQKQNNELLFFNTPNKNYRLGSGDVVKVILRGLKEQDVSLKVSKDGMIVITGLPPTYVNGKTIEQAESELLSVLKLDDASASAFLYLDSARLVAVQVSGNVKSPKTIAVPAYTPLSRVFAFVGGISETGSLRNILLQHQDGSVESVDFYNFLTGPFQSKDPIIRGSSRIFVGNKGATIAASGYVARPGIYELPANISTISIMELLEISGTSLIPPGAIVEILSFNKSGIAQAFAASLDENINQGESLRIRFVKTRDLDNISIKGAVLESYDFASSAPVSIRDILKNGSVLKQEALLSFAMIEENDGKSKAINITDALKNNTIKVPPGSTLHVFTQDEFNSLVKADPNKTKDPLVAKISETEIGEIYLNGRKIAFVPPSADKSFYEVMRPFYSFTPQTVLDFALVQTTKGVDTGSFAVSVRQLLQKEDPFDFENGTKVFLFEREFYSKFLQRAGTSDGNLENSLAAEFSVVGAALNDAKVASIILDGQTYALLPSEKPQTLKNILETLGGLPMSISNDLAILSFSDAERKPEAVILTAAEDKVLVGDITVDIFTENGLRTIVDEIERGRNDMLATNIQAHANKIFIDGKMIAAFGQSKKLSETSFSNILRSDFTIYPIFSTVSEYNSVSGTWDRKTFTIKQLLNESLDAGVGARFDLLTKPFVTSVLEGTTESELLMGFANASNLIDERDLIQDGNDTGDLANGIEGEQSVALMEKNIDKMRKGEEESQIADRALVKDKSRTTGPKFLKTQKRLPPSLTLEALQNSSRFVGGGVERPGSYPAADNVTLIELIQIAGGFTPGADINNIVVQEYQVQEGKLGAVEPRIVDGEIIDLGNVILSGQFSVNIQTFINDAFSGSITLSGEVNRPGEYIFARSETLHDILDRASGFSDAAYPLGAVFERESAKEEEQASNVILAEKIEQSVLQLSTSAMQGAGEQINAVLGFAKQLKEQEPIGRLSVNVLLRDQSVPIYLEDGDRLAIPKRPSHVSIIGSVSQSVRAYYSPNKRYQDYIANAGGFSRIADKGRVYMLLPNGEASPLRNDTIIPPGSVLIIPPKTDKLSILGLTDLVSRVLGNIATSLLAINNVK